MGKNCNILLSSLQQYVGRLSLHRDSIFLQLFFKCMQRTALARQDRDGW